MTITIDPFTTTSQRRYPVGYRVKSLPPLSSQPAHWGTVLSNNGIHFTVKWDFVEETHTYDLATETKRGMDAHVAFIKHIRGIGITE